jgi:hypothetical protein
MFLGLGPFRARSDFYENFHTETMSGFLHKKSGNFRQPETEDAKFKQALRNCQ